MKKKLYTLLFFMLGVFAFAKAQTEQLARNYFDQGQFEKALLSYKKALVKQPNNSKLVYGYIATQQQLEGYDDVQTFLEERIERLPNSSGRYLVELGYNYQLQQQDSIATIYYNRAIDRVSQNPSRTSSIGRAFQDHSLLEQATQVYETGMAFNPKANYTIQLARIYGELGQLENMFDSYLFLIFKNEAYLPTAQRNFGQFITENPDNEANQTFRKLLLKKLQTEQSIIYNELLSWLFIQQGDFKKAFAQEKAIYKRSDGNLQGVINLAEITIEENEDEIATEILQYLSATAVDEYTKLEAEQWLLQLAIKSDDPLKDNNGIATRYEALLDHYGFNEFTIALQRDYAHFTAFNQNDPEKAITFLKKGLKERLSKFNEARLKMELADILVLEEKFNQALIYYSQVQNKVKNNILSQEARLKVAKTSYYKSDFSWAENQLNVLKSSATQLIANDALKLLLTIRDNSLEDTTQTALKLFAKADLLRYQNKNQEALVLYNTILEQHKGEAIEDEALLEQAKLFEADNAYVKAEKSYQKIISFFGEDILADEAHYRLALLYENQLQTPEKAKEHYERIIFDFADSIYYVEAQKRFRQLRGDAVN